MSWTKERTARLRELHARGLSSREIAHKLDVSRDSVIGKLSRLKLGPATPVWRKNHFTNHGNRFGPVDDVLPVLPTMPHGADVPVGQRRTLLQLGLGICKWPFGEPQSSDFFFCGGGAVDGKPYCQHHCSVAYKSR